MNTIRVNCLLSDEQTCPMYPRIQNIKEVKAFGIHSTLVFNNGTEITLSESEAEIRSLIKKSREKVLPR